MVQARQEREAGQPRRKELLLSASAALLALIGLVDSLYLTAAHFSGKGARCLIATGCSRVLGSSYAEFGGVPLSLAGAGAYFLVFSFATLVMFEYHRALVILRALVAFMFAVTLWLLYLQHFVIKEYCDYCLVSAAVTTLLMVMVVVDLLSRSRAKPA